MKILIIGNGGREHCLGVYLSKNPSVKELFFCLGNGGTESIGTNINATTTNDILAFAKEERIDLTIVGSEQMLVEGIVDRFESEGLDIFGPDKQSAKLEGSKVFAKDFMNRHDIPTARYQVFNHPLKATNALKNFSFPLVVKASGLAAGKGVIIVQNEKEAIININEIMIDKKFGDAGNEIIIEEFLEGFEVSLLSFYNGKKIFPMLTAKDHKKIGEKDTGLNTGGMGVVAPNPLVSDKIMKHIDVVINKTLNGLISDNIHFKGVIFFGLMVSSKGVFILEYNLRLGDPETQAILPLLKTDLLDSILSCHKGLDVNFGWNEGFSCCVVASSKGYPKAYNTGHLIHNLENIHSPYFIAGAKKDDNKLVTNGGRVLNVVGLGKTLDTAIKTSYEEISKVSFDGMYFRRDIGKI